MLCECYQQRSLNEGPLVLWSLKRSTTRFVKAIEIFKATFRSADENEQAMWRVSSAKWNCELTSLTLGLFAGAQMP